MRGSIYSVSDKAMFDAINQSKVTSADLKKLFLSRGIIISPDSRREDIAKYFSSLIHDYFDYENITQTIGHNPRKEKNSTTTITSEIHDDIIESSLYELQSQIQRYGATCSLDKEPNKKSYTLDIKYHELNYNNSELRQISKKEARFSIEQTKEGLIIRHPQNKTVEEWKALLIANFESELESEVKTEEISLSHTSDHVKVTDFFIDLITNIKGFDLHDVTDVYVFHPTEDAVSHTEESDISTELGTHISKAALKGQNVLQSDVLKEFYDAEFYISKVIWRAKIKGSADEDIYEFEAQFSDAENKESFSYIAKGYYTYISDGNYSKSRKRLSKDEEKRINRLIEISAMKAMNGVGNDEN